jgi:hypothetical protein
VALVINATPGAADANSYLTLAEATAYFESRAPLPAWDNAPSQEALLVMATRVMDMALSGSKILVDDDHYRIMPKWAGAPATETQALAWPRIGMLNRNGFAIPSDSIPNDLKAAVAELAGQLAVADLTLDNKIAVQGIQSVSAGPVSVSFKNAGIRVTKLLPDSVLFLLVPSWYTEETTETIYNTFDFEVIP